MQSPREALRLQITEAVRAALPASALVASSLARDVPAGTSLAVSVYSGLETGSRVSANGEARKSHPIKKTARIIILVSSFAPGDGEAAQSEADTASRLIELELASAFSNLTWESSVPSVLAGESTGARVQMEYSVTYLDNMQGDPAA